MVFAHLDIKFQRFVINILSKTILWGHSDFDWKTYQISTLMTSNDASRHSHISWESHSLLACCGSCKSQACFQRECPSYCGGSGAGVLTELGCPSLPGNPAKQLGNNMIKHYQELFTPSYRCLLSRVTVFSHQQNWQQLFHIDSFGLYEFPHHMTEKHTHAHTRRGGGQREGQRASLAPNKENPKVKSIKSRSEDKQLPPPPPPPHRFNWSGLSSPSRL